MIFRRQLLNVDGKCKYHASRSNHFKKNPSLVLFMIYHHSLKSICLCVMEQIIVIKLMSIKSKHTPLPPLFSPLKESKRKI